MTPTERDMTLRHLLGRYLAHPDPDAWAVAADLYEETCDGGTSCCCRQWKDVGGVHIQMKDRCARRAEMWRSRSRHYGPLMATFDMCLSVHRLVEVIRGDGAISFRLRRELRYETGGMVDVVVCRNLTGGQGSIRYWMVEPAEGKRYHTRRCLDLIDMYADLFDGAH